MTKAHLTLLNGIVVQIEGTVEEVRGLLQFYASEHSGSKSDKSLSVEKRSARARSAEPGIGPVSGTAGPNLSEIVNLAKNCDEAGNIEKQILDRSSQIDRALLPLYIVHEHLSNAFGLTSGDISKVTRDLRVFVDTPNVSGTLSGRASKYVIGDKVRKRGQAVHYRLSRRGLTYLQGVIGGLATAGES